MSHAPRPSIAGNSKRPSSAPFLGDSVQKLRRTHAERTAAFLAGARAAGLNDIAARALLDKVRDEGRRVAAGLRSGRAAQVRISGLVLAAVAS